MMEECPICEEPIMDCPCCGNVFCHNCSKTEDELLEALESDSE